MLAAVVQTRRRRLTQGGKRRVVVDGSLWYKYGQGRLGRGKRLEIRRQGRSKNAGGLCCNVSPTLVFRFNGIVLGKALRDVAKRGKRGKRECVDREWREQRKTQTH